MYYFSETANMFCTFDEMVTSAKAKLGELNNDKYLGFVIGKGYYLITKEMAKEFYRDLCRTLHSDGNSFTLCVETIASIMHITTAKANAFLYSCADYGITERQGGAWVV